MHFDDLEFEIIEEILLGDNKFNSKQREIIELFETKVIIAGPGAGKTTALAAKIILILQQLNKVGSKEGICVITYTNVAVDEINKTLQRVGISGISHPHFIGTIHEFFNKYCVIPYFKKEYNTKAIMFDTNNKNDVDFYKYFISNRFPWINQEKFKSFKQSFPDRIDRSKLNFKNIQEGITIENSSNWDKFYKYKDTMLEAKLTRKRMGFLTYDDTFFFSEIYLSNMYYVNILRNRFRYIFIDEFQDTTTDGLELLKKMFITEKNMLQMIGDPYQTITYNQPMPIVNEKDVYRLNITNRFGQEISKPLNRIMPNSNIQTAERIKSFTPILLVYKNERDIYDKYKEIVSEFERNSEEFKCCMMEDKVLVWAKKWVPRLKNGERYKEKKNSKNMETKGEQLRRLIIEFICKRITNKVDNLTNLREWAYKHPNMGELNTVLLDFLKYGSNDVRKNNLISVINKFLIEKGAEIINQSIPLFQEIDGLLANSKGTKDTVPIDDVFTIHSVKGETLRSALIINFEDGPLTNILFHRYGILGEADYSYTDHNLLYVAISRVSYLLVYAIHEDIYTEDVHNKFQSEWIIIVC